MFYKKLTIVITILMFCQLCLAQNDEKEYEHLFQLWQEDRALAFQEWNFTPTLSSLGPDERTKSYNALVAKSAKLIPFLLKHIKDKRTQEEYRLYISLLSSILKIKFEYKYLKDEKRLLLTDYDIKYPSLISLRMQGNEEEFVYEQELWWDHGRLRTPEVFAKKYQAYSDAIKEGDEKAISCKFEQLQNMGIIILPNLLEKMEGGDNTLLPMFAYLSGQNQLNNVSECRKWWDANKEDYNELLSN